MKEFLLSVVSVALICAICQKIPKFSGFRSLICFMCGIIMLVTLIRPILGIEIPSIHDLNFWNDGRSICQQGENLARQAIKESIISRTEAYILKEARLLGAEVAVQVSVTDDTIPIPDQVTIRGSVSPYARSRLQQILKEDLSIGLEEQYWID